MAITNGYCSLVEFKAYADIDSTDVTDDGVIEDLIETASRYIDKRTRRYFWADDSVDKYYTAEMSEMLITDPIQSITSLKTDGDSDRTYSDTWETTDFDLMPFNAESSYFWIETTPEGNYSFPKIAKGVKITGKFGYAAVPDDIKTACLEITKGAYGRRYGQNTESSAEITAAGIVLTPKDITAFARSIINAYKRIV